MPTSGLLVVDANLAVRTVVPAGRGEGPIQEILRAEEDLRLLSPAFWVAEAVSSLRKLHYLRLLSRDEAEDALAALFLLEIESVPVDRALSRAAFGWAERLGQSKAYDAFYLALAEREKAALWTADRRLADRARQVGAEWVQYAGEG